jgi:hypothetical protein
MSLIGNPDTPTSYVADYMQACVGLFGIPAGGFTDTLETYGAATDWNVESLYAAMLNSSIGRSIFAPGVSNQTFATTLVGKLGGSLLADATEAAAIDVLKAALDGGMSQAAVAMAAVEYVAALDTTDADFGAVAQQFQNRVTIANYYTFSSTAPSSTLSTLTAVLSGVSNTTDVTDPEDYIDSITDPAVSTGQTYTLTTNIDSVLGTTGNDTIIGDASTLSNADQVNGGAGTDTLKMFGTAGAADIPAMTGVENVYLSGATASHDFSSVSEITSVEIDDAADNSVFTVGSAVSAVSIANILNAETIGVNVASSATSANVTLNKVGNTTANAILDLKGAALATLNLTTASNASYVELGELAGNDASDTLTKVTIAGDKALTLSMDATQKFAKVTTVDASANTAGVTVTLEATTGADVTFTGGTGNDSVAFGGKFTKADVVNGGDGTDTLSLAQADLTAVEAYSAADKATVNTNLSNLEILKVSDALTGNIDASRYDSINQFVLAAGINNGGTSTISKIASGVSVTYNDAAGTATDILALTITDATVAGNNSDTVNLVLNDAAAGGASDLGVVDLVGVDILNIDTKSTTAAGAAGTTTSYTLDIKNTSTALDKVVVTGSIALDISTVALVNSIAEVDASGMTLAAATSSGLTVAIAAGGTNGVKITGSGGIDTITGSAAADVIDGGAGADVITSGAGGDRMTGGAGNDNFKIAEADASITSTNYDTINDYSNGTTAGTTDKITYTDGAGAVGTATGMTGWTANAGVVTKSGATLADFLTDAALADTADNVVVFWDGTDSWVYNNGGNDDTSTADDSLVCIKGVQIVGVVTADTTTANELVVA